MNQEIQELTDAMAAFLDEHGGTVVSASRVVNPLLNLWSLAHAVDPIVAAPIEELLTALRGRTLTTPDELTAAVAKVRDLLGDESVLAPV